MSEQTEKDLPRGLELTSLSPTFRENPFAAFKILRENSPIFEDGQLRDHIVLDAGRVYKILSNPSLLVDPSNLAPTSTRTLRGEDLEAEMSLLHSDGVRHKRLRSLMLKAFSKSRIDAFRSRAKEICETLLDAALAKDEFDFVAAIGRPMPTIVITELLGVDESKHEDFKVWSDQIIAYKLNPLADEETREVGELALKAIDETLLEEVNRRIDSGARPNDLISGMMEARTSEGECFSTSEISQNAQLLLIAGNQTTTDVMGTLLKNLLENGDSYRQVAEDKTLIAGAIEETLRFEPPIFGTERITPEPFDLEGVTVPKGHVITAMLTSANRDPALNENPDTFDIHRQNNKHFAFGGGAHRCIGAPLAKMECDVLLEVLIERCPGLTMSDKVPVYDSNPGFRSLESLWVRPR